MLGGSGCVSCGRPSADMHLDDVGPLCDRCFDDRVSASTGVPRLLDPPEPVVLADADGVAHTLPTA